MPNIIENTEEEIIQDFKDEESSVEDPELISPDPEPLFYEETPLLETNSQYKEPLI